MTPGPHGLVLAAGAGSRYGMPKALVPGWLATAVDALRGGGCTAVTVVLGDRYDLALRHVPAGVTTVACADWAQGMSASLRCGLRAVPADAGSVMIHLVDLPDVGPAVVERLAAHDTGEQVLVRATYQGRPGHPVLIGRAHWAPIIATAEGDAGAAGYLRAHGCAGVECGDLASGTDRDRPESV